MKIIIRDAEEKDYDFILKLNQINVNVLSPLDKQKLLYFFNESVYFKVAEVDNYQSAFIIALNDKSITYNSENYLYFKKHYHNFIYIDRIVIDEKYRSMKLGSLLYEKVFDYAIKNNFSLICAEIDIKPYNEVSLRFHEKMGFNEVGIQSVRNNTVKVSLQIKQITKNAKNEL